MILYLGNALSGHGFTPTSVETLGERLKEDFYVIQASSKKNVFLRLLHMWYLVLKWRKADFLLIDTYSTSAFTFAWTSARLARIVGMKYIPILHGGDLPKRMATKPGKLSKYLKEAEKVVCPSEYLKKEMGQSVDREYQIIPNFIDVDKYPFTLRKISGDTPIRLFWLRSFHKIYNPNLAVQLLKALIDKGYSCELCMIGPDKDGSMAEVQQFAETLGVTDSLDIRGKLSKADWIDLSVKYNVFINTTNVDNTPVSVMEAMALGFPVITTNAGGMPYLLKSGVEGVVILPDRVDLFILAVEGLINDKNCREMSTAARTRAESWDWQRVRGLWKQLLS